jgi:hypothetical protein
MQSQSSSVSSLYCQRQDRIIGILHMGENKAIKLQNFATNLFNKMMCFIIIKKNMYSHILKDTFHFIRRVCINLLQTNL